MSEANSATQSYRLEMRAKAGANWFFWIAGLSLINSVVMLTGGNMSFIVGLGITQMVDAVMAVFEGNLGRTARIVGFAFNVFLAGIFVGFGVLARKRLNWAFIVGMVVYALDGLLFVGVQEWLSLGFHGIALFCIFTGFKANKELMAMPPAESTIQAPTPTAP